MTNPECLRNLEISIFDAKLAPSDLLLLASYEAIPYGTSRGLCQKAVKLVGPAGNLPRLLPETINLWAFVYLHKSKHVSRLSEFELVDPVASPAD